MKTCGRFFEWPSFSGFSVGSSFSFLQYRDVPFLVSKYRRWAQGSVSNPYQYKPEIFLRGTASTPPPRVEIEWKIWISPSERAFLLTDFDVFSKKSFHQNWVKLGRGKSVRAVTNLKSNFASSLRPFQLSL